MKKYIALLLLPVIFQCEIYGSARNRSMAQLNSTVERYIVDVRLSTDVVDSRMLDIILDDLTSYAKIGSDQYQNSMAQLKNMKQALEEKRNEIYNRSSTLVKFAWAFGKYPGFVIQQIDPAVKSINETSRSIYLTKLSETASNVGYVTAKLAGVATLIASGFAIGYFATKNNSQLPKTRSNPEPSAPADQETKYSSPERNISSSSQSNDPEEENESAFVSTKI